MKKFSYLIVVCALGLMSCDQPQKGTDAEDNTNPFFRQAIKYNSEQNYNAAIKEYEKALRANPMVARAHKEMGLLYSEKLGDAISGIYHFQRYLQARPDAPDKDQIQTYIDKAKIDFVLTMPNSPMQNAEETAKISKENVELKQALAQYQGKLAKSESNVAQLKTGAEAPPPKLAPTSLEMPATPSQKPVGVKPPATPDVSSATPPPATDASAPARKHIIAKGDSLWKIAAEYYPGDVPEGIAKIKKANPEATGNERNLKLGQELIIP